MYDPLLVQPMRDEVTELGFEQLVSADQVDAHLRDQDGTALVFVNSVCGCAAGNARPALRMALDRAGKRPGKLLTVFAGQDPEPTAQARSYFVGYQPSSPQIALLKDGDVVYMIERHHIESSLPDIIARSLLAAFEEYC